MPMGVPALGVRQRQPADERRKVAVLARPKHQMPVVRHHAIGQQTHLHSPHGLDEDSLERFVILRLVEYPHPGVRPVEHMVREPAGHSS